MYKSLQKNKVLDICVSGLLIALVLICTMFINVRLPISINGGLIHMGNVPLIIASIIFGKRKGAIAGAFGMGLFDILSGWAMWAPFTFVIRGVMGYTIGYIAEKHEGNNFFLNLVAVIIGGIWMIFGYYVSEVILYGNLIAPITSVPGDILQIVLGSIIALPAISILKKNPYFKY